MPDFSTTVNGDPWQSPSISDGPVTTMGAGSAGGTATGNSNGLATDVDVSDIESPLSAWLANSRWSRRDLELLTDLIGAVGTLGFLYLALNGVGA